MTVYGGELQDYGTRKDGFFVSCTKCGWHSKVEVEPDVTYGDPCVSFKCNHCGNEHLET
jgi:predicted RNA-binding Zn-ribbon protein involved in translation (DUF1610 family)